MTLSYPRGCHVVYQVPYKRKGEAEEAVREDMRTKAEVRAMSLPTLKVEEGHKTRNAGGL